RPQGGVGRLRNRIGLGRDRFGDLHRVLEHRHDAVATAAAATTAATLRLTNAGHGKDHHGHHHCHPSYRLHVSAPKELWRDLRRACIRPQSYVYHFMRQDGDISVGCATIPRIDNHCEGNVLVGALYPKNSKLLSLPPQTQDESSFPAPTLVGYRRLGLSDLRDSAAPPPLQLAFVESDSRATAVFRNATDLGCGAPVTTDF